MNVTIRRNTLTDGSETFDVVVGGGNCGGLVLPAYDESSATELADTLATAINTLTCELVTNR